MHTPTHNPHKPILLFTTTSIHTTIPKQRIGNYGVCGWKDRCRDGNLRTYCHVSPILFGWFFVEASPTCFCIFVKCFFIYIYVYLSVTLSRPRGASHVFKMATLTVTWMPSSNSWRRKRQRSGQVYCIVLSSKAYYSSQVSRVAQLLCKQRYEGWRWTARSSDKERKFQVA